MGKPTKAVITQEEKYANIEYEEIGNIDWLVFISALNRTEEKSIKTSTTDNWWNNI